MARRKHHEEHINHEAWAIPYGDLITLLLAFFVVMYAISSLNEGKYRVLADSLSEAFGGPPRTIRPLQLGDVQPRGSEADRSPPVIITSGARGPVAPIPLRSWENRPQVDRSPGDSLDAAVQTADRAAMVRAERQLAEISARVEQALVNLIDADLVKVRRTQLWLEVEINSDVLFASGVAEPQAAAVPALVSLANALQPFPNPIRVEGHTDDIPIRTLQFPSNWELSSARASSVVQLFDRQGITPDRLAVIGYGEHRPVADNATPSGRNANRRVVIVVLATPEGVDDLEGPAGALEALDQGGPG